MSKLKKAAKNNAKAIASEGVDGDEKGDGSEADDDEASAEAMPSKKPAAAVPLKKPAAASKVSAATHHAKKNSYSVERSRNQVQCRPAEGQSFRFTFADCGGEEKAIKKAKKWLRSVEG